MSITNVLLIAGCLIVTLVRGVAVAAEAGFQGGRPSSDVASKIDHELDATLLREGIAPSPIADDAEFLRRVYLDLNGRIPTLDEAREFLADSNSKKRAKLVDQLLAREEFGRHFANVWYDLIVPRTPIHADINPEALRSAFADCFQRNLPWNETVGKLLLCSDGDEQSNFLAFYRINGDMGGKPMANVAGRSFARLFLGIKMECSECHDDPSKVWKQRDYWGLAAYFGRVVIDEPKEGGGKVKIRIMEGRGYQPPKGSNFRLDVKKDGALVIHAEAQTEAGAPVLPAVLNGTASGFAANEPMLPELVAWVKSPDNPYLAPAAVNRVWSHLFARGLVNPVDDFHPDNPPTHPEVLAILSQEFQRSGFDIKHLLRCLCATQAYQRSSRPVEGNAQFDDPRYARMPLKVLTAEMLLASLEVAYDEPALFPSNPKPLTKRGPIPFGRRDFLRLFKTNDVDGSAEDYGHGIVQMLHLLNTPVYNAGGRRVASLTKQELPPEIAIATLYLATLSRPPTPSELRGKLALVNEHDDLSAGYAGVLWTLVSQSEFLINH